MAADQPLGVALAASSLLAILCFHGCGRSHSHWLPSRWGWDEDVTSEWESLFPLHLCIWYGLNVGCAPTDVLEYLVPGRQCWSGRFWNSWEVGGVFSGGSKSALRLTALPYFLPGSMYWWDEAWTSSYSHPSHHSGLSSLTLWTTVDPPFFKWLPSGSPSQWWESKITEPWFLCL